VPAHAWNAVVDGPTVRSRLRPALVRHLQVLYSTPVLEVNLTRSPDIPVVRRCLLAQELCTWTKGILVLESKVSYPRTYGRMYVPGDVK
jgi:hypothetical protein